MATEQHSTKTPRSAASRLRLMDAAAAELAERRGALEVDSVAQRAGVSVGLIYRQFGSRAGLVAAVMDDFYGRYRAEVLGVNPAPGGTWAERERRRTRLGVAFHYHSPLARVALWDLHLDSEVAVHEARQIQEIIEMCAGLVALGQSRNELPADRDPDLCGAMIIGGMRRVIGRALATPRRPTQKRLAEQLWLFIAGTVGIDPRAS